VYNKLDKAIKIFMSLVSMVGFTFVNIRCVNLVSMNWKHLTSIDDLDTAIVSSENRTVVLFKHSTRCSISRMALKMFESDWDESLAEVDAHFLDLLEHRDISAAIAEKLGVSHQSPQMIVLQAGRSIHHANHSSIDAADVKKLVG
jgi:bacillithiol system protein YtxJ